MLMSENNESGFKQPAFTRLKRTFKDVLKPDGRRFDIDIDTPENVEKAIQLLKSWDIETEAEVLRAILNGYHDGALWTMKKFDYPKLPHFTLIRPSRGISLPQKQGYSPMHDMIYVLADVVRHSKNVSLSKKYPVTQQEV